MIAPFRVAMERRVTALIDARLSGLADRSLSIPPWRQTEWQALTKVQGLGTVDGRHALASHVASYTCAFIPVLIWIAEERSLTRAIVVTLLIALPHVLVDDGSLVRAWMRDVKRSPNATPSASSWCSDRPSRRDRARP